MPTQASPGPWERGTILLAQRARFHTTYRLAVRAHQAISLRRAGAANWQLFLTAACGIGDVAGALVLRSAQQFALMPRLILDMVDTAAWSLASEDSYDLPVLAGVPLASEAGIRLGATGFLVPVANAGLTAMVRRRFRRPANIWSFRWQAMAVAFGAGLAAYEASRRRAVEARHAQLMEAERQRAFLVGQNAVACDADSVVDLISRTYPLLQVEGGNSSADRILSSWKASLAANTSSQATYLGVALARWQRRHNAHPDLSSDVMIQLSEDQGTVVLTPKQAQVLEALLDDIALSGKVPISLANPIESRLPNRPRRLVVDHHPVELPADPRARLAPLDVGPVALLAGACWLFDNAQAFRRQVPRWATMPGASGCLYLAGWAHREISRQGDEAHPRILLAASGLVLVNSVLSSATMRAPVADTPIPAFPFLAGGTMVAAMLPLYLKDLSSAEKAKVLVLQLSAIGAGLALLPGRPAWDRLAAELLWPVATLLSAMKVPAELAEKTAALEVELADRDESDMKLAFADGRSFVISLVSEARYRAWQLLGQNRHSLDSRLSVEAERRLVAVDRQLEVLGCESE